MAINHTARDSFAVAQQVMPGGVSASMRLNPFKNIRLSFQLYSLVTVSLLIASGLIYYAMNLVQATQGTLKHTIDNRMVSGQSIQGVADALNLALEDSLKVIEKTQTPQEAHDEIKAAMDKAHEDSYVRDGHLLDTVEHPSEGTIRTVGIPVKFSATPGSIRRLAPLAGQDTAEVLAELN